MTDLRNGWALRGLGCVLAVVGLTAACVGQKATFRHSDGTTHHYEVVAVTKGVTWAEANAAAARAGGYLATITSAAENAVVFGLLQKSDVWNRPQTGDGWSGPWLGGVRSKSMGRLGWGWANLEPMTFTAFSPGSEEAGDRIHYGGSGLWDDSWAGSAATTRLRGYVIERSGSSAPRTLGALHVAPQAADGYRLINHWTGKRIDLIDRRGRSVHRWNSTVPPGMSNYLLAGGHLLRLGVVDNDVFDAGGVGGVVEKLDWNSNVVWQFKHSTGKHCLHHDVAVMPNGNILMVAWELKSGAEALAAGRNPERLEGGAVWSEKVIEVRPPTGQEGFKIVWEWHVWDHLVQEHDQSRSNYAKVAAHPELIDVNYGDVVADWLHINAIDYNAKLDQICLSVRTFSEVWIIDHSTTTAQAASHRGGAHGRGGDLIYRWGNPAAYKRGTAANQKLFVQHNTHWIPAGRPGAGNLLVFNNGAGRLGTDHSSVDEIVPPVDSKGNYVLAAGKAYGPAKPVWSYAAADPKSFYSPFISGAERLPGGNTLICSGLQGRVFEVTKAGKVVWEYESPAFDEQNRQGDVADRNWLFRAPYYRADDLVFAGHKLTPREPIERQDSVMLIEGSTLPYRTQPGATVNLSIRAGAHPWKQYWVGSSASAGSLAVDYRIVNLAYDAVLGMSLAGTAPATFQGYTGILDASGRATARIVVPNVAALRGLALYSAFLVEDRQSRSQIAMISNVVTLQIE